MTSKAKLTEAIFDFSQAIIINPKLTEAYTNRGRVYGKQGKFIPAIDDYNKAIEINPNLIGIYFIRGLFYLKIKKDYDKAWADVHKAEALGYKPG